MTAATGTPYAAGMGMEASLMLFRVDGASRIRTWQDLDERAVRPFDADEARRDLLPLLPAGARWPAGSITGGWRSSGARFDEIEIQCCPAAGTVTFYGEHPSIEAVRRLDRWLPVDPQTGALL